MPEYNYDVVILGAGSAGMAAYREASKYTEKIALIDGGPLGTTCARVGCMPSKLLIAAAEAAHNVNRANVFGVRTQPPIIDGAKVMKRIRSERDRYVGFAKDALERFEARSFFRYSGKFVDDHTIELGNGERITAKAVIIATGSRPNIPAMFEGAGDRLIVNDDVFDWTDLPEAVAVYGTGAIGLELGQALSRLGVNIQLFGRNNVVGPLSDPKVREYAFQIFEKEFSTHWNAHAKMTRNDDKVVVSWSSDPNDTAEFDYVIAATGRRPNIDKIGLENTTLPVTDLGLPIYDPMSGRIGESHVFIAGDANTHTPLMHEAIDEGRLAGENAARLPHSYRRKRRTSIGIVFSDPQIGMAGMTYASLVESGVAFEIGEASYEDQGRARILGINKGLLRIYAQRDTGKILGAEMIGPHAEHLISLLAWAIQSDLSVEDALHSPFYHPVLEEGVRTALRKLNYRLGFGPNPPLRCIDCGPGA